MNTTMMTDIILAVISPSQYQWWEIGKHHGVGKNIMVTVHDVMPEVAKHHGHPGCFSILVKHHGGFSTCHTGSHQLSPILLMIILKFSLSISIHYHK